MEQKYKLNLNPLHGMQVLPVSILLILAFLSLSFYFSGIFKIISLILLGLVALNLAVSFLGRLSQPWRRIHFALMTKYAGFLGAWVAAKKMSGKDMDKLDKPGTRKLLAALARNSYRDLLEDKAKEMVASAEDKMLNFTDREEVKKYFMAKGKNVTSDKLNKSFDKIINIFQEEKNFRQSLTYFVTAEIVEKQYGKEERIKYIVAVLVEMRFNSNKLTLCTPIFIF